MKSQIKKDSFFGCLKDKAEIVGDIVSAIDEEWEAERNNFKTCKKF